ncbi:hypothetical protein [Vibrio phage vB_VpaP_SJSY21]|nr:hypothetical protein [Vibrio phage vB_VpaP_SJSY21]
MEYSRDYKEAFKMFIERPDMFTYDGFEESGLLDELREYSFFIQEDHITAFKAIDYGIAEVHTYTRACVNPRTALRMLNKDVEMLSLQFHTLITYVPDNFRGTINFLEKRLGFTNFGECATREYSGKTIKVNLLKRTI